MSSRYAVGLALALIVVLTTSVFGPGAGLCAAPDPASVTITPAFPSGEPQPPELSSKAAIVVDADTGEVIFAKEADMRLPMASTTKMMTAILVLEQLDLNTRVVVSRNAHFQSGSVVGLHALDSVSVEQLLYWLLVFSGNDAAVALAEKTSGSVDKFVAQMNAKADQMGLTNTHFRNVNGLDTTDHFSSCTDLAAMARYALQNETFRKIVKTTTYDLPHPSSYTPEEPHSSNALLTKYDWVTGVKTGSTPQAGYCMVASGTRNGVSLIVVQLGAKDDDTRWAEVEALFRYGFDLRPATVLTQPGRAVATLPLGDALGQTVELAPVDRLVVRMSADQEAIGTITLTGDLSLPLRAGEPLGTAQFTMDGETLGETELVARCSVYIPTVWQMLVKARNWYLPEFQLSERGERYPH